jgi:hypothetical protein
MRLRWNTILMLIIIAALCFGGSFTCAGSSGDVSFPATQ